MSRMRIPALAFTLFWLLLVTLDIAVVLKGDHEVNWFIVIVGCLALVMLTALQADEALETTYYKGRK